MSCPVTHIEERAQPQGHVRKQKDACEDTHKAMGRDKERDVHLDQGSIGAVRSKEQGMKRVKCNERQQETFGS